MDELKMPSAKEMENKIKGRQIKAVKKEVVIGTGDGGKEIKAREKSGINRLGQEAWEINQQWRYTITRGIEANGDPEENWDIGKDAWDLLKKLIEGKDEEEADAIVEETLNKLISEGKAKEIPKGRY